jgi:SSS family solute:Na+ symporter
LWGAITIGFALSVSFADNLVQLVNILGSLFYGTILGVFLAAFFFKRIGGNAIFIAAINTEFVILMLFFFEKKISYLWLNPIGALLVIVISCIVSLFDVDKQ